MELENIPLEIPDGCNLILGHSHFIKTVEDLHEIMVGISSQVNFGLAFCEASGPRLIRVTGNNQELQAVAVKNAQAIAAGHSFIILLKDAFPINFLNSIKQCQETCQIYCATANPVEVIIAQTEQGRGILGVIDGYSPLGVETEKDKLDRGEILRKFGYKL
jgi:adenosine/AMP kinase